MAEHALEKGVPVELVLGPLNPKRKELIKGLLRKYPDTFKCHVLAKRPAHHFTFFEGEKKIEPSLFQRICYKICQFIEKEYGLKILESPSEEYRPSIDLFIEECHPPDRPYETALCIEDAHPEVARQIKEKFSDSIMQARRATLENIDSF